MSGSRRDGGEQLSLPAVTPAPVRRGRLPGKRRSYCFPDHELRPGQRAPAGFSREVEAAIAAFAPGGGKR